MNMQSLPSNLLSGAYDMAPITNPIFGKTLQDQLRITNNPSWFFSYFIPKFIIFAFIVGVLAFLASFIIGAIGWISSGGDKNAIEAAKGKITNAIIGLIILFSLFAVLYAIEKFFGVTILSIDIDSLIIK
jgi:hypothetical protein